GSKRTSSNVMPRYAMRSCMAAGSRTRRGFGIIGREGKPRRWELAAGREKEEINHRVRAAKREHRGTQIQRTDRRLSSIQSSAFSAFCLPPCSLFAARTLWLILLFLFLHLESGDD